MKERDILRQIKGYLDAKHVFSLRLNTGRMFIDGRLFQAHDLGPGTADILVPAEGSTWIEVKNERGQQSSWQKEFEAMVRERGDRYLIARSIDDLDGWI